MRWRRVWIIAGREFRVTVRRREFLLLTLGLPLFYFLLGTGISMATMGAAGDAARHFAERTPVIGWIDNSGRLDTSALVSGDGGLVGRLYREQVVAQQDVRAGRVRALIVVPTDFLQSGQVTVYVPADRNSLFGNQDSGPEAGYISILRRALLARRIPPAIIERVVTRPDVTRLQFDTKTRTFLPPNPLASFGRFLVPYACSLLLVFSVMFSSSYLLHGIVEEKENRVIEMLLSAATHEELLTGKLFGLGGAGLTQLGVWLATASAGAVLLPVAQRFGSAFVVSPELVATGLVFFLLGFGFYAALMAGIGSFGTSWRESQQISGSLAFLLMIPLTMLPVFLESPDGALSRVLSLLPPTAPVAMLLRVAAGGASPLEVGASALLLAVSVLLVVRLSARLFRLSLLLYGQRPGVREVWRWLRENPAAASGE
jgi:ABC-2 type transport system permease protein